MRTESRTSFLAFFVMALSLALTCTAALGQGSQAEEPTVEPDVMRYVRMDTNLGSIYIALNETKAPVSTKNFLSYTEKRFYDGTIYHRVISNFMIQGGGFAQDLKRRETDPPIANEWRNGLKNRRGTIAMARTAQPDSATSQFFINVKDNPNLDQPISGGAGYAVFGHVIAGMDVVDEIRNLPTRNLSRAFANIPVEPVVMKQVREIRVDEAEHAVAVEAAKKKEQEEGGSGTVVKTLNSICPMSESGKVNPGAGTSEYLGHTIGFCCAGCRASWEAKDDEFKTAFIRSLTK